MNETKFVFNKITLKGVILKSVVFSENDLKVLLQGLYYAKIKQEGGAQKETYDKIYCKLWELINKGV